MSWVTERLKHYNWLFSLVTPTCKRAFFYSIHSITMITNNNNELVQLNHSGNATTTSRKIAETFGKQHAHVLRDIQNLECSQEFNKSNFGLVDYKDQKGELRPEYLITRDGFSFLAMGFTGKKASEFKEMYIKAFNAMEKPQTPALPTSIKEVAMLLLQSEEEKEKLLQQAYEKEQQLQDQQHVINLQTKELQIQAPLAAYTNRVLSSNSMHNITLIAKELGYRSAAEFNTVLVTKKIQYKQNGSYVLTAPYQGKEYTATKTHIFKNSLGDERSTILTVWTEKGRNFLHTLFNSKLNTNLLLS